jgi:hypothetical protein
MNNKLAVDDIKFKNCQYPEVNLNGCAVDYFTCERKACVSSNLVCDLTDDCGDNSGMNNCFFHFTFFFLINSKISLTKKTNQIVIITRNVILRMDCAVLRMT